MNKNSDKQKGKGDVSSMEEMHYNLYDIVADSKRREQAGDGYPGASVHSNTPPVIVQSEREQPDTALKEKINGPTE